MSFPKEILGNVPSLIQDPEHPCYGFASVVNGQDIAIHKNEISAVLTAIGGQFVKTMSDSLGLIITPNGQFATPNALDFYNYSTVMKKVMGEEKFENLMTLLMMYEDACTKHLQQSEE
jgi:hypothetical protein